MNRVTLLEQLKVFTKDAVKDLIMPTAMQEEDVIEKPRAADVYLMRLPDSHSAKKKAPYILHQLITGADAQPNGQRVQSTATVRTVFAVYSENEQEGGLMLLNLMERLRIALLRKVVIGNQFQLDLGAKMEILIYPEDTAPYYSGEMISEWIIPAVEREVIF